MILPISKKNSTPDSTPQTNKHNYMNKITKNVIEQCMNQVDYNKV